MTTSREANSSLPVETEIYFMRKEERHQHEKAYAFRYCADTDCSPTNFVVAPHNEVTVEDLRGQFSRFSVEDNGFTVLKLPSEIPYEDYFHPKKVVAYFDQLELLLKEHLGASRVEIFRHAIRKRHPLFPLSTGGAYDFDQPTSVAHIDTTPAETLEEVKRRHRNSAPSLFRKRIQWINIWKPLRGPVNDWPLTICDTKTVDAKTDLDAADLLFEDHVAENFQVHFSQRHRWYYISDHHTDELIVFKQSDSDASSGPGVPHSSFFNPRASADELPRESIEARALVYYD